MKSYILSEMRSAGSLNFVYNVITELYNKLLQTFDEIEDEIGVNKKLRILIIGLKV